MDDLPVPSRPPRFWFTAKFAKEVRKGRQERERSIASYFCSAVEGAIGQPKREYVSRRSGGSGCGGEVFPPPPPD